MPSDVTLCITAGGRPDLLRITFATLLSQNAKFFHDILVTNDRGDEETNHVIHELTPQARLFSHDVPLGQHPSIDEMYSHVTTEFIFHCEDDWCFDPVPFIPVMQNALTVIPNTSSISARQTASLWQHDRGRFRAFEEVSAVEGGFVRRSAEQRWTGHSFNPAMLRTALWKEVGPFAQFRNEAGVNAAVEATGKSRLFLVPGVYFHIGGGRHMPNIVKPPATPTHTA